MSYPSPHSPSDTVSAFVLFYRLFFYCRPPLLFVIQLDLNVYSQDAGELVTERCHGGRRRNCNIFRKRLFHLFAELPAPIIHIIHHICGYVTHLCHELPFSLEAVTTWLESSGGRGNLLDVEPNEAAARPYFIASGSVDTKGKAGDDPRGLGCRLHQLDVFHDARTPLFDISYISEMFFSVAFEFGIGIVHNGFSLWCTADKRKAS